MPPPDQVESPIVRTIGHSTRTLDEFTVLLQGHRCTHLVDVRTVPHSRRNPQFNRDTLPSALHAIGIAYTHCADFGGLRRPQPDSHVNTGWRHPGFRGFADYMQTPVFEQSIHALLTLTGDQQVALMCAEAVPWRCHRSLIADALLVRGVSVQHILGSSRLHAHSLTPWAVVDGTRIRYPDPDGLPGVR